MFYFENHLLEFMWLSFPSCAISKTRFMSFLTNSDKKKRLVKEAALKCILSVAESRYDGAAVILVNCSIFS